MTLPWRATVVVGLAGAALFGPGCVCGDPPPGALASCVELEAGADPDALPSSSTGRTLPITGAVVGDDGFAPAPGGCRDGKGPLAHAVLVDAGQGIGRVRFSWESDVTDLAVDFAEGATVTVDDIVPLSFEGGSAFAISDDQGLALAVDTTGSQHGVGDDITIQQGDWRATGANACGTFSTTNARVSVRGGDVTAIEVGEEKDVRVGDVDVTVHVFRSFHLEEWHCTDSSNSLVWSLARH